MAWSDLITKLDTLLQAAPCTLVEAPELFSIQLVPKTKSDKTYCILSDGLQKNPSFNDSNNSLYPDNIVRVSVMYELGNNSPTLRNDALTNVENIIRTIINPANRSTLTRIVEFSTARGRLFNDGGFWYIFDIIFKVNYELNYS
jgi:hypothetical protein